MGEALGYTNVASVANRFRLLRKRHGFHNLDYVNNSGKGDDKPPAPSTKDTGKAGASTMTNTVTRADETSSDCTEEGEPGVAAKRQRSPQKKTQRKGAKVSSKPIPATTAASRNGSGSSKAKGATKAGNLQDAAAQSDGNDRINSFLLDAVERVVKEEAQEDAKLYSLRKEA